MVVEVEQQMLIILHRMVMVVEEVGILMLKFINRYLKTNKNFDDNKHTTTTIMIK